MTNNLKTQLEKLGEQSKYKEQGELFLNATNTKMTVKFLGIGRHFEHDKIERPTYKITLQRENRKYSFSFGDSIAKLKEAEKSVSALDYLAKNMPSAYDILACLQKYDVGSFDDFCSEFGYSNNSINTTRIYKSVVKEFAALQTLYSDSELEAMQAIA